MERRAEVREKLATEKGMEKGIEALILDNIEEGTEEKENHRKTRETF